MASLLLGFAMLGVNPAVAGIVPELPRVYLDSTYSPPIGNTIVVNAGGNLQAAINAAVPGDTIVLQAGATFTGTFTLPNKGASTNWIYIRSSAIATLPSPGNRVGPGDVTKMATIVGTGSPVVAIQTLAGAHHYRFVGIEFKPGPGLFTTGLVRLGAGETSVAQLPNNIVIDRCYIHGDATLGGRRGISLNAAAVSVVDSYLSDWKESGSDSQAIAIISSTGPIKLLNNHLEGAGENVIIGGGDPPIAAMVPADIEIRGNRFFKPVAWRPLNWTIKNLFELKNSRRVLIEGNVFEYDWQAAQDFAINIKSSNQDGTAPFSGTLDVTFRHNIIRHGPSGIKICALSCDGALTQQGGPFLIQNNVFDDINAVNWGGVGNFLQTGGPVPNLTVNHNTVVHNGSTFSGGDGGDGANTGFQYTDNISQRGPTGFKGSGTAEGIGTLNRFFPGAIFTRNVIIGASAPSYPADNFFPVTYPGVRFQDFAGGNFKLAADSLYRSMANDGKDVGADIDAVNAATVCAVSGQCVVPLAPSAIVNPFSFTNQTNVEPGALVTSNVITVGGTNLNYPVTISMTGGGAYSVGCTSKFTALTGLVSGGQTVCIRYRAPPTPGAVTTTTLMINGVSAMFTSTNAPTLSPTGDADNDGIPNAVEITESRNQTLKDNDIFNNARLFAMQQYRDLLGREGDAGGITFFANQITANTASRPAVIDSIFRSAEFQQAAPPVVRLYFATFLRLPDYDGLAFQVNTVRASTPLSVVANNFTLSPEFQDRYGALPDPAFVTLLYQNILSRSPSPAERDFHVNRLASGATRGEVLIGFSESPEYVNLYKSESDVIMLYASMLRRLPDGSEFSSWVSFLDGGNALINIVTTLYNGTEYRNRGFIP